MKRGYAEKRSLPYRTKKTKKKKNFGYEEYIIKMKKTDSMYLSQTIFQ